MDEGKLRSVVRVAAICHGSFDSKPGTDCFAFPTRLALDFLTNDV